MDVVTVVRQHPQWGEMRFDVTVAGPPNGELVLLLHGFPETRHEWRHQIEALAGAGYRVAAPDQRGYSPGARPADVSAYVTHELVGDVLAIADALGAGAFHLVGHDWGGAIAWQVAGRHPDRLRSLAVLAMPHPAAFGDARAGRLGGDQPQRSGYIDLFRAEDAESGMLANDAAGLRLIYLGSGLTEDEASPYLDVLGQPEALRAALNWYRAADLALTDGLGPITAPTLYVWSDSDIALGPEAAHATGDHVEGPYRFEVLDGVDHWIAEHAPEDTNRLLLEHLGAAGRSPSSPGGATP